MKPPKDWKPLPSLFTEWWPAASGNRELRYNKYIDDCVKLKEIDVRYEGEGVQKKFYWREHKPDLFD